MRLSHAETESYFVRENWRIYVRIVILALSLFMCVYQVNAQSIYISSIEVAENDRIVITFEGPEGDYLVESSSDLTSGNNWIEFIRLSSDGQGSEVSDPISEIGPRKFYRVSLVPVVNGFYITGEFAQGIEADVDYASLQTAFGLTFEQSEAVLPAVEDLIKAARNARVYAATIATLSKIAIELRDTFDSGSEPTIAQIVAALALDLASGDLNGRDGSDQPILIGTTGIALPEYTSQNFIDQVGEMQDELPGLENVVFEDNNEGFLRTLVPACWAEFYWDGADWQ